MQRIEEGAHPVRRSRPVAGRPGGVGCGGWGRKVGAVVPAGMHRHAVSGPHGPHGGGRTGRHSDGLRGHADEVVGAAVGVPHPVDPGLSGAGRRGVGVSGVGHDEVQLHHAEHGHDEEADEAVVTVSCGRHQGSQLEGREGGGGGGGGGGPTLVERLGLRDGNERAHPSALATVKIRPQ